MISPALAWWLRVNSSTSVAWHRPQSSGVTSAATHVPWCFHASMSFGSAWWHSIQPTPAALCRDDFHCSTRAADCLV